MFTLLVMLEIQLPMSLRASSQLMGSHGYKSLYTVPDYRSSASE